MKNFKLYIKLKEQSFYAVSHANPAYGFFKSEFHNLPEVAGAIIVPANEMNDRTVEYKSIVSEEKTTGRRR